MPNPTEDDVSRGGNMAVLLPLGGVHYAPHIDTRGPTTAGPAATWNLLPPTHDPILDPRTQDLFSRGGTTNTCGPTVLWTLPPTEPHAGGRRKWPGSAAHWVPPGRHSTMGGQLVVSGLCGTYGVCSRRGGTSICGPSRAASWAMGPEYISPNTGPARCRVASGHGVAPRRGALALPRVGNVPGVTLHRDFPARTVSRGGCCPTTFDEVVAPTVGYTRGCRGEVL